MNKSLLFLITLLISFNSFAQPNIYMDFEESFWSKPYLVLNGEKMEFSPWGGTDEKIIKTFEGNQKALEYYNKYISRRKISTWFLFGGLGAALLYSLTTDSKDYDSGTYWGVFIAGFIPGIYFQKWSQIYMVKSFNYYNGAEPLTTQQNNTNRSPYVLGMQWAF